MKRFMYLAMVFTLVTVIGLGPALSDKAQDGGNVLCNGLSDEDCALVVGAMSGEITSFSAPAWEISLIVGSADDTTMINLSGSGEFVAPADLSTGEGLLVHLVIDEATSSDAEGEEPASGEILIRDNMVFVYTDGQWYGDEITAENAEEFQGLAALSAPSAWDFSGLEGMDFSTLVTTARGTDTTVDDQTVTPFVTTIDITAFLMALLYSPFGQQFTDLVMEFATSNGMQMEGMTPEVLVAFLPFVAPLFQGTSITLEQGVGQDDNLLHHVGLDLLFEFDSSGLAAMMGAQGGLEADTELAGTGALNVEFHFFSEVAEHNATFDVPAPTEYRPLDELDVDMEAVTEGVAE